MKKYDRRAALRLGMECVMVLSASEVMAAGTPPLELDARALSPLVPKPIPQGTATSPTGPALTVDSRSLLRGGVPWLPVSGEFHYSRYPADEWRDALLQIKAGGVDIVASYVFWIHHEEEQGKWDWSGQRDLRRFLALCGEVGLHAVVRCGPWAHGEVRNGGLPDWVQHNPAYKIRSTDPGFLADTRKLYEQIAAQTRGLLYKNGGPVIGIQCDNEYGGPAEYLVALKRIAREVGLDVPLYTRTGWPALSTPMPEGELLPLFGSYAEGFWDRELRSMPGAYGDGFLFLLARGAGTAAIGTDQLGNHRKGDDTGPYPYFCCEIGGGMASSYHRRLQIMPMDVFSTALVKVGSGNNLQGYYMYHGGTNPEGKLSTLQESQATNYWNDLPVKTYDFNAPLGEYGQPREHYHRLRLMHLFLRDWGSELATMPARVPVRAAADSRDTKTLRWSVRTDGKRGFLFVSNYQRRQPMPAHPDVQFQVRLPEESLTFPTTPVTIPADSVFFWAFRVDLGGALLEYATAQPICRVEDGDRTYVVFAETEGIPAEFVLAADGVTLEGKPRGNVTTASGKHRITQVKTGTDAAVRLRTASGKRIDLVLLGAEQALHCWKGQFAGRERIFLTDSDLVLDGDSLQLRGEDRTTQSVALVPAPASLAANGKQVTGSTDGVFRRFTLATKPGETVSVESEVVQKAGAPRTIANGSQGVAEAPVDADFATAAAWRLKLPTDTDAARDLILRIPYVGDVARVYLDGKLIEDHFYNGVPMELGLKRFAPRIYTGELVIKILPLGKDAPIFIDRDPRPADKSAESYLLTLGDMAITERKTVALHAKEDKT